MKVRFLFLAMIVIAMIVLFKRLFDTQEKLLLTEAELAQLQRESTAREAAYAEVNAHYQQFDEEHPLPDDPDKKIRVAPSSVQMSVQCVTKRPLILTVRRTRHEKTILA